MFKKKLKIKQIVMSNSESFWYVCGLGNDGNVYIWDKIEVRWILNKQIVEDAAPQPALTGKGK